MLWVNKVLKANKVIQVFQVLQANQVCISGICRSTEILLFAIWIVGKKGDPGIIGPQGSRGLTGTCIEIAHITLCGRILHVQ